MIIYVDIDNTICKTIDGDYENAIPIYKNIDKVNELYDKGHIIIYWTARGTLTQIPRYHLTIEQFKTWNVNFHELRLGKPVYDLFIDDRTMNPLQSWNCDSDGKLIQQTGFGSLYASHNDTAIIIQARTNSSRLKNKIMLPFYNQHTLIDIIVNRLKKNKSNIPIILAITDNSLDDTLYDTFINDKTIDIYRGNEDDVLNRFISCANHFNKKKIIRVCSDNPFISLKHIERLYETFLINNEYDYMTYTIDNVNPTILSHIGVFAELTTLDALNRVAQYTQDSKYTEHVTKYIYTHQNNFKYKFINYISNTDIQLENIRLTLDTKDDYTLLKTIYQTIYQTTNKDPYIDIPLEDILIYLSNNQNIICQMKNNIMNNTK